MSNPQGRIPFSQEVEPWPDEVDGADLLSALSGVFSRHLSLPRGAADAAALWIIHCHAFDAFPVSPFLTFSSPEKRCGKTSAMILLRFLVPKPLLASNLTPASAFRMIDKFKPTLLVDEAETFVGKHEEFRGILNAGHTREASHVIRCVGRSFEPRAFSVWCPKAIALIGSLPSTLEDRSIIIPMRRKTSQERVEPLRMNEIVPELTRLSRMSKRWAADNKDTIASVVVEVPSGLHDRAADNWTPLLQIAEVAGGAWRQRGRDAADALTAVEQDPGIGVQLLGDIKGIFREKGQDSLSSEQIVQDLAAMEDRAWPEHNHGKPITKVQLARLLRPFGIHPTSIRTGPGSTPKGYRRFDFEDAFTRYLPAEPQQPQQEGVF